VRVERVGMVATRAGVGSGISDGLRFLGSHSCDDSIAAALCLVSSADCRFWLANVRSGIE